MRTKVSVLLAIAAAVISGCGTDTVSPTADARVSMQDQCDPASFNAALGSGTCTKQGTITFTQFNNELSATHQVAAWRLVPSAFSIKVGQSITATNDGGEKHTFTEVKAFGGGIVPALNSASGNTQEAPECAALSASDMVAAGATFPNRCSDGCGHRAVSVLHSSLDARNSDRHAVALTPVESDDV